AVVFTLGFIVLVVVRDEVPQRQTVVRGDEVHAGCGHAPTRCVQVTTAGATVSELTDAAAGAAPEGPHRRSLAAHRLCPPDRKRAELVAAFADVPRLGDELEFTQRGRLMNQREERRELIYLMELARQSRRKVESTAIDSHFGRPVAERVHDQRK